MARRAAKQDRGDADLEVGPPRTSAAGVPAVAQGGAAAHFLETHVLVPLDSTARGSNTPTSKSVVVRLERR